MEFTSGAQSGQWKGTHRVSGDVLSGQQQCCFGNGVWICGTSASIQKTVLKKQSPWYIWYGELSEGKEHICSICWLALLSTFISILCECMQQASLTQNSNRTLHTTQRDGNFVQPTESSNILNGLLPSYTRLYPGVARGRMLDAKDSSSDRAAPLR